jgi:hypothetical protein
MARSPSRAPPIPGSPLSFWHFFYRSKLTMSERQDLFVQYSFGKDKRSQLMGRLSYRAASLNP